MIPHYGPTEMLREAVLSVRGQDSARWRLHVVEDGLQDRQIGPWLQSLDDDRIHHHVNPETLGTAGNFQRCLELSTAPWVTLLGCDDLLHPNYVSNVLRAAGKSPRAGAIHPRVRVVDNSGRAVAPMADRIKRFLTPPAGTLEGDKCLATLLHGNWAYFPAVAWRRDAIEPFGFRPDLPITLDLALLADVLLSDHVVVLIDEPGIRYRRHPASASSAAAREASRFEEEAKLFLEIAERARHRSWNHSTRAARWHLTSRAHSLLLAGQATLDRDTPTALRLLKHSAGGKSI